MLFAMRYAIKLSTFTMGQTRLRMIMACSSIAPFAAFNFELVQERHTFRRVFSWDARSSKGGIFSEQDRVSVESRY